MSKAKERTPLVISRTRGSSLRSPRRKISISDFHTCICGFHRIPIRSWFISRLFFSSFRRHLRDDVAPARNALADFAKIIRFNLSNVLSMQKSVSCCINRLATRGIDRHSAARTAKVFQIFVTPHLRAKVYLVWRNREQRCVTASGLIGASE